MGAVPSGGMVPQGTNYKLKWQHLQSTVPIVVTLMSPIEKALRETFFPEILGGGGVDVEFWKIPGHSINHGSIFIPDLW